MFLKISIFKTLLKNAWKGAGLTVGIDGDGIYLMGGYWSIWLEKTQMTKKAKAAIMELTGEFPPPGSAFKAWKDQNNQYEMSEVYDYDLYNPNTKGFKIRYENTGVMFDGHRTDIVVLQNQDTGKCIMVSRLIMDMVDINSREEGESLPTGPIGRYGYIRGTTEIFWQNEACTLKCMPIIMTEDTKETFVLDRLAEYDFAKGEKNAGRRDEK